MHWQKIIETYNSLPEGKRTSVGIAFQLREKGCEISASQICKVLKHTVLEDCIDTKDLLATAKVLQRLVDFSVSRERPDKFDLSISIVIENVMDGLPWHTPEHYETLSQIRNALSHIVNFHYEAQQRADQLAESAYHYYHEDDSRYRSRDRSRNQDNDIPQGLRGWTRDIDDDIPY